MNERPPHLNAYSVCLRDGSLVIQTVTESGRLGLELIMQPVHLETLRATIGVGLTPDEAKQIGACVRLAQGEGAISADERNRLLTVIAQVTAGVDLEDPRKADYGLPAGPVVLRPKVGPSGALCTKCGQPCEGDLEVMALRHLNCDLGRPL